MSGDSGRILDVHRKIIAASQLAIAYGQADGRLDPARDWLEMTDNAGCFAKGSKLEGYTLDVAYALITDSGERMLAEADRSFVQLDALPSLRNLSKDTPVILGGFANALILTTDDPVDRTWGLSQFTLETYLSHEDDFHFYFHLNSLRSRLQSTVTPLCPRSFEIDTSRFAYHNSKELESSRDSSSLPLPLLGGSSGAGLWALLPNGPYLIGVHSGLSEGFGRATKVCRFRVFFQKTISRVQREFKIEPR